MSVFGTPEALLDHWQGHRKLTRRVIEAFPADHLLTFSAGGMLNVIDNDIHHRGQGCVYLRALGIKPPAGYGR